MELDSIIAWVEETFPLGDRRRTRALGEMAYGLMKAGVVSFAAIGRGMRSKATAASAITRVFKFCHNALLDVSAIQAALLRTLVGKVVATIGGVANIIVVAVDWHSYDNGEISGLRVSLVTGTRALPLRWYEIKTSELSGRQSEIEMKAIRDLIRLRPLGVTWLILMDAGFRSHDLIELLGQAGYYIVRSSGGILAHSTESCWTPVGQLPVKLGQLVEFGWVRWSERSPSTVRLVASRLFDVKPVRARRRRRNARHSKNTNPGLCAVITNLPLQAFSASLVIRLYARRFEIEHNFRDIKNASLGMDMEHVHLRDPDTYSRLMCIVAVAEALLWLAGAEAEAKGLHYKLTPSRPQSRRRVLSLRNVGRLCLEAIHSSIDALIATHLASSLRHILDVVGRGWRDAQEQRFLANLGGGADQAPPLSDACNRRGKGGRVPCRVGGAWNTELVAPMQAA